MSDNLKKMFDEQNKKILINKIKLDIDNNTDSLKLIISNVIMLEMHNLKRGIVNFCFENNIKYDEEELEKLFISEKEELKELAYQRLEKRKENFIDSINDNNDADKRQKEINTESIDCICKDISKEMAINFLPKTNKVIKIENEDDLIRINSLVRAQSDKMQNRIGANINTRFMNLINIINESKNTSLEMLEKTGKAIDRIETEKRKNKVKKSGKRVQNN